MRSRSEGRSAAAAVDLWTRKLHYYVGLYFLFFLWLFSFTGLLLNHPGWTFAEFWPQRKQLKSERPVHLRADLSALERARDVMAQLGIRGEVECGVPEPPAGHFTFRASRPGNLIEVDADAARDRAVVNETVLNGWGILHVLHLFSGTQGDDGLKSRNWFLTSVWIFSMDALAAGLLFMLASGIYVWCRSGRRRVAGGIVLALGMAAFALLLAGRDFFGAKLPEGGNPAIGVHAPR